MKLARNLLFLILILPIMASLATDVSAVEITRSGFTNSHFIGARFGAWIMTGDDIQSEGFTEPVERSSSSLYGEFFYAHRFSPVFAAEFSLGVFDQGDITYNNGIYFSAAKVYPILASVKIYPFGAKGVGSLFPYLRAGAGLGYGSRDLIVDYYNDFDSGPEDTEVKFIYAVGGGFDWPVSSQIGLLLDFKYVPIDFGSPLAGFKDYSGWELSFGIGYIYKRK